MTTETAPAESGSTKRSPAFVAVVVVVIVAVLAGGGFVVYKLTNKHTQTPAFEVAKVAITDIKSGQQAKITAVSTPKGAAAIAKLDPTSVNGLVFAKCKPFPGKVPTRLCTWTRPGGQLTMALVKSGDTWKVDDVKIGPAGLPPATGAGTSTTT
jgi:hypothetical protein